MLLFLIIFRKDNLEPFSNSKDLTEIINQEYQADFDAINNLSEISNQLLKKGMIVPADLIINGKFKLPEKGTIFIRLSNNNIKKINLSDILIHNDKIIIETSRGILKSNKDDKTGNYHTIVDGKKSKFDKKSQYKIEKVKNKQLENTFSPLYGC